MWFADIFCNIAWFTERRGDLGRPRGRVALPTIGHKISVEMLVYGDDFNVCHLRVLMNTSEKEIADACINDNLQFWIRNLEVATGLLAATSVSAECLPNTTSYMVMMGEGDETASGLCVELLFSEQQPIDYAALAQMFTCWKPAAIPHLFYFSRFLDKRLSPDVRWLNGYRLAEWHFQQGAGLQNNERWRMLLEEHRAELQEHLRDGQTLHGFFEETRAMAAHAMLDRRPVEQRAAKRGDQVVWTFKVMEKLVVQIMNDKAVCTGQMKLSIPV
jgi:hypothetical protein